MVKKTTVRDVMTPDVIVAHEDTRMKELVRMMAREGISGVPIVAGDPARLTGIVTEADLLKVEAHEEPPRSFFLEWFIDRKRLERIEQLSDDVRAREVMTRDVVTVTPDTPIDQAVRTILAKGFKRLPVVDQEGRVQGIVSRRDLLGVFLRPDDEIRREVEDDVIYRTMWIVPGQISVTVKEGVVGLEGEVELKSTREILVDLVRRVSGVVGVDDHVSYRRDDRTVPPEPMVGPHWSLLHPQIR